jgi:DNA-binding protein HU-beta
MATTTNKESSMATRKPKNPELAAAAKNLASAARHTRKAIGQKLDEIGAAASEELTVAKKTALTQTGRARRKIDALVNKARVRLKKAATGAKRTLKKAAGEAEKTLKEAKKAVAKTVSAKKPAPAKKAAVKRAPARKAAAKKAARKPAA